MPTHGPSRKCKRRGAFGDTSQSGSDPHCRSLPKRVGRVDSISYTRGGYQITTIDGVKYGTLWDWREMRPLGLGPGAIVEYVVSGRADPYDVPYAVICRVLQRSSQNV